MSFKHCFCTFDFLYTYYLHQGGYMFSSTFVCLFIGITQKLLDRFSKKFGGKAVVWANEETTVLLL